MDFKNPTFWLATWFGCGLMRPAPGTWGSIGALPVGLILYGFSGFWGLFAGTLLISIIGVPVANRFDALQGSHDNKMIVIDEVAGQWIALLPALSCWGWNPLMVFISFGLFRFFDIVKPWPVRYFDQKISGGLGVMLYDIAAGLYVVILLLGVYYAGSR